GNKKVTGTGTTFADTKNGVAKGHLFCITSGTSVDFYEVDYVVSNTELYLVQAYRGVTATGKAYEIITTFSDSVPEFARRLTATLSAYQQQSDAFQALLTSTATTVEVTAPDGTKQTLIPWKRVTSEGEGQAARAKTEADKAAASAAAAAAVVSDAALPFPDVWAPLTDGLNLLAGYGTEIKVGADVVARKLEFTRASTATYFDKSGIPRVAAINEPRFEKNGLLIEGASTNLVPRSELTAVDGSYIRSQHSKCLSIENGCLVFTVNEAAAAGAWIEFNTNAPQPVAQYTGAVTLVAAPPVFAASLVLMFRDPATGGSDLVGTGQKLVMNNLVTPPGTRVAATSSPPDTILRRVGVRLTLTGPLTVGDKFVLGFPQIEPLPFASSYIPTTGTPATRAADRLALAGVNVTKDMDRLSVAMNFSAAQQTVRLWDSPQSYITFGGTGAFPLHATGDIRYPMAVQALGIMHRFAISMDTVAKAGSMALNGKLIPADRWTDRARPSTNNDVVLGGSYQLASDRMLYGHIKNLRIWHAALPDEQLKAIR
uniref:phage head spike fiber domain-containing protein n=1 Tax=Aeromonas sp. QDB21 TaxID=2990487 RepID=UPI0022E63055